MKLSVQLIFFATIAISSSAPSPDLRSASIKQIEKIQEREGLLLNALVPEKELRTAGAEARAKVPDSVRLNTLSWIRMILRDEWVPEDIGVGFIGLKDIKQVQIQVPGGIVSSADLVISEYHRRGFGFHLIEDGVTLSVRVDLPEGTRIANERASLRTFIAQFFKVQDRDLDQCSWEIHSRPYIFYGWIKAKAPKPGKHGLLRSQWWEQFTFGSDGTFLFINAGEIDENSYPGARACCPNRF